MNIAVLAKVVPDYEVPSSDFELVGRRAHERYKLMIGLYDENAIEVAIQLKEKHSARVMVISYGSSSNVQILRKSLAMGGDELYLINGDSDDPFVIAANLKQVIDQMGQIDLILGGRQSSDFDRGIVPGILAEMLGYAYLNQVSRADLVNGQWVFHQITETGSRELRAPGPLVLSITSDPDNIPRIPAVRLIFAAKKKPVHKSDEIQVKGMEAEELEVEIPQIESSCEFLNPEEPGEAVLNLLARLKEDRLL